MFFLLTCLDFFCVKIGGVVYTTAKPSANGQPVMATEWTNFMSWNQFCIRVCFGNNAERHCEHIYGEHPQSLSRYMNDS